MNDCIWWADCYSPTLIEGPTQRAHVVIESLDSVYRAYQGSPDPWSLCRGVCITAQVIVSTLCFYLLFYTYCTNLDTEISYLQPRFTFFLVLRKGDP